MEGLGAERWSGALKMGVKYGCMVAAWQLVALFFFCDLNMCGILDTGYAAI